MHLRALASNFDLGAAGLDGNDCPTNSLDDPDYVPAIKSQEIDSYIKGNELRNNEEGDLQQNTLRRCLKQCLPLAACQLKHRE
jgi:hypothetical protein